MDKLCVLIELISGFCTSQENTQRVTDGLEFFINTYPALWKFLLEEFYEGKISLSFKVYFLIGFLDLNFYCKLDKFDAIIKCDVTTITRQQQTNIKRHVY